MKKIIFVFFLIINFCGLSFSQKEKGDFIIEKINGVKYYIHSVEKGSTLYSISKKYGVTIDEILKSNPEISHGLRIGQQLKIPVNKSNPETNTESPVLFQGDYLIHEVAVKETLYSISKKYNIKVKEIIDINPETSTKDLSIGQKLKIPLLKSKEVKPEDILPAIRDTLVNHLVKKGETLFSIAQLYQVKIDSIILLNPWVKGDFKENKIIRIPIKKIDPDSKINKDTMVKPAIVLKDIYNLGLLLPFHCMINDSLEKNLKFNEKSTLYNESEIALLFYEGAMLALDSLKKSGVSARVHVFDTSDDSSQTSMILINPVLKSMDLLVGPFYQFLFKDAATIAKQNETGITCPVPQSAKILLDNKYASKVIASPLVQADQLADYVIQAYPQKKLLVFSSTEKTDMRLARAFLDKSEELVEKKEKTSQVTISDYYFADINIEKVKALLSLTDTNYIILPSHNQVFVSDMLTKLNSITDKYSFVVLGLDKLTEFENIDINYLHKLNVHVASPFFIDYDDPKIIQFISLFREKYKTEPGKFGFLGFDVAFYYLSALNKYGKNFYDYLPEYKKELYANSFDFIKTGFESGCENKHVYILKYDKFKLVRVN